MTSGVSREYGIGASKRRHGFILGGGLVVFGLGVLLLAGDSIPDRQMIGLLAITLGAGVGFYAWWTSRDAGAVLRIDASGVWFKDWGVAVPWTEIGEILHTGHKLQPFVSIQIREPDKFFDSLPSDVIRKMKSGRLWKNPFFRIPNGSVDTTQQELLVALRSALKEYG